MTKSMTGFGHAEVETDEHKITVEIKAVNHRYCDVSVKLPKKFNAFENTIRTILKEYASRGKIDIYINYEEFAGKKATVTYHETIAKGYMDAIEQAAKQFGIEPMVGASSLIRYPEVLTLEEQETEGESLFPEVEQAFRNAAEQFSQARIKEGEHLKKDLLEKLSFVSDLVTFIEERSPKIIAEYQQKIKDKVEEMLGDKKIDDAILATEITVFADKICVDEETVRLRSHIKNMTDTLNLDGSVGRKLDFIAQEMNREANTILSKANDTELSNKAIDLKTEIEKIREQIQNIE